MARAKTNFFVEETLTDRVRQTAERMRWSMADATELAFELFLKEFENARILGKLTVEEAPLTPEPSPELEQVS